MPALQGIFIPTYLIYHPHVPPAILVTWVRLHCMVRNGSATRPLSIHQLTRVMGKSQATFIRHISQLKSKSALDWRFTGDGRIIISFPDDLYFKPEQQAGSLFFNDSTNLNTENSELPGFSSYFPPRILGYLSYQEDPD